MANQNVDRSSIREIPADTCIVCHLSGTPGVQATKEHPDSCGMLRYCRACWTPSLKSAIFLAQNGYTNDSNYQPKKKGK